MNIRPTLSLVVIILISWLYFDLNPHQYSIPNHPPNAATTTDDSQNQDLDQNCLSNNPPNAATTIDNSRDQDLDQKDLSDNPPNAATTTDHSQDYSPGEAPASNNASIDAVFLAQTHVMQPDQPYFKLVGNRDTLLKVHVISPRGEPAPKVIATIINEDETATFTLVGPEILPTSLPSAPGKVQHKFADSFTTVIPGKLINNGLAIEIQAGSSVYRHKISVGAPTVLHMIFFGINFFRESNTEEEYPDSIFRELKEKLPVAKIDLERVHGITFPEMVIPAHENLPAVRITSEEEYLTKTGHKFIGKNPAAARWVHALSRAGGNSSVAVCFINILGGYAGGGEGGNFTGSGGSGVGVLTHELGHALGLPHNSDNKNYPYHGAMFGIQPPKITKELHVGPTWAFDFPSKTFIPPTVQAGGETGGKHGIPGTYKAEPMQGGGSGDQEPSFMVRHFSDYNVHKMQAYIEKHMVVRRDGNYYKWNDTDGAYTTEMENNGVEYPITEGVPVISVMAAMSLANPDINMVYPPIGPYRGNLIRTIDPRQPTERKAKINAFSQKNCRNFTLKITQGNKERYYLLPDSDSKKKEAKEMEDFSTEAINVPAEDGKVTAVELLSTPQADTLGLPDKPQVLARWLQK